MHVETQELQLGFTQSIKCFDRNEKTDRHINNIVLSQCAQNNLEKPQI